MKWMDIGRFGLGFAALAGVGAVAAPTGSPADGAGCPARLDAMIAAAYPDAAPEAHGRYRLRGPDRTFLINDIACGPVPGADGLIAVLVPIAHEDGDGWLDKVGDLEVLVFGDGATAPRHRLLEKRLASDDAFSVSGVAVDHARYDSAGPAPVFGVLLERSNGSRHNPASITTLRLYRIAEGRLETILSNLAVRKRSSEWNGVCEGETEETRREVLVGERGAGGPADLTIIGRTVRTVSTGRAEPCKETTELVRDEREALVFDGRGYEVPEALRGYDEDYR